jgi:hypothetical protein
MSAYTTKDKDGSLVTISGREKNLLISVYQIIDSIASEPEWEIYWKQKYAVQPVNEFSNSRKLLWITEEHKWLYTDMHKVNVYPTCEIVEQLIAKAIDEVRTAQTRRSKFLDNLAPQRARELLELFNCFEWI